MCKLRAWALFLTICLICVPACAAPAQSAPFDASELAAQGAVLIERTTGRVLFSKNMDRELPMASTTKIMTALLALERLEATDVIDVDARAHAAPGSSIYLDAGERLQVAQLLQGLLIQSGNDCAIALACAMEGDEATFAELMTQRARELGAKHTRFANASGLPAQNHYTTAYDLALIARAALDIPEFRELVTTQRASIPWEGHGTRALRNKNRLLTEYEGATGVKTGFTEKAGRCLVFSAQREGMELVGVLLNCGDWFESAKRMLDYGFQNYKLECVARAGEVIGEVEVERGARGMKSLRGKVSVMAAQDCLVPLREGERAEILPELPECLPAPVKKNQAVGWARIGIGGESVADLRLYARDSVTLNAYWDCVRHVLSMFP